MIDENQIYIVVDIEADGPAVGRHSMLSLAAVAVTAENEAGRFYRKLTPLEDATPDPDTIEWWKGQPEAWDEVTTNAESPDVVMKDFCRWIEDFDAEPIFVANPVALDYTFVSWYLFRFAYNPFMNEKNAIRTLDMLSFISGKYGRTFNNSRRARLPSSLNEGTPEHTHKAIDDAIGHSIRLRKILKTAEL